MWIRNTDTGKWTEQFDSLSKEKYEYLKQDLDSIELYSNCLSGSNYYLIDDIENLYEVGSYKDNNSWFIFYGSSPYSSDINLGGNNNPITPTTLDTYQKKYLSDYGFSLKSQFTPTDEINSKFNSIKVELATTGIDPNNMGSLEESEIILQNINISSQIIGLIIDGQTAKDGDKILVKDQISFVSLLKSVNPDSYFSGRYYLYEQGISSDRYLYYTSENGIYIYNNNYLIKDNTLENYESVWNLSTYVKSGDINTQKEFHLLRKSDGYYPLDGEILQNISQIEFLERKSNLVRNKFEYGNVLDLNFYDVIKHATQSIVIDSYTFSVPGRTIFVGEYGSIVNNQDNNDINSQTNLSKIIWNQYRVDLKSICQTDRYYWICGYEGTILKMDKVDFSITRCDISDLFNLKSIHFYDNLRGVCVGEYNRIFFTNNGGINWVRIEIPDFESYSYNCVLFTKYDQFFIIGDGGIFIEFTYDKGEWIAYLRTLLKTINQYEDSETISDLNHMIFIPNSSLTLGDIILLSGNSNTLIVYDYAKITGKDFIYLDFNFNFGDIKSISFKNLPDSEVYVSSTSGIYKFKLDNFSVVGTQSNYINYQADIEDKYEILGPTGSAAWSSSNSKGSPSTFALGSTFWNINNPNTFELNTLWEIFSCNLLGYNTPTTIRPIIYEIGNYNGFCLDINPILTNDDWSEIFATQSTILSGSTLNFYAIIGYADFITTQDYSILPKNKVGDLDKLWLVGQLENGDWEQLKECDQVWDSSEYTPAYSINSYKFTKNYISIGFIVNLVNQKNSHIPFIMNDIRDFNISYDIPIPISDIYANKIFDYESSLSIIAGNSNIMKSSDYDYYEDMDPLFGKDLKSKLLFLNYDISSKLNFFDDWGEYRLPNSFSFSVVSPISEISLYNLNGELNWWNYYKDTNKVFEYGSPFFDDLYKCEYSGTFSFDINTQISFTSSVVTQSIIGATSSPGFSLFLEDNVAILNYKFYSVNIGDVFKIESDVVEGIFIANRVVNFLGNNYVYFYTNFNKNIINNLLRTNNTITFKNLNKFTSFIVLESNFNCHPIGRGWKMELIDNSINISPIFNNYTAYYNMQSIVSIDSITHSMVYEESFLNFGYSPTYNILDYLSNIDSSFDSNKVFSSMPIYRYMPCGVMPDNNIFLEFGINILPITYSTPTLNNKIWFGSNLEFEYETLWINTFVDIYLYESYGSSPSNTIESVLIEDKYYDEDTEGWVVVLNKPFDYDEVEFITIKSRNTLGEISQDLQILNNIQRSSKVKTYYLGYTVTNLENDLNKKFNTDSYAKILLSDGNIKEKITGIVYTDYNNKLTTNIINLPKIRNISISSISLYGNRALVSCSSPHKLNNGDSVILKFENGSYSDSIHGWQSINVINIYQFWTTRILTSIILSSGIVEVVEFDPFLNIFPTDLIDVTPEGEIKIPKVININNYKISDNEHQLTEINTFKDKFKLVDSLVLSNILRDNHWLMEAEIFDSVVGKDESGDIVWYSGIWKCGRWMRGTWMSGTWMSGDFYSGTWKSRNVEYNGMVVKVGNLNNLESSKWYSGRWFSGNWESGTWYSGRRYDGDWNNGIWYSGIWNDGIWMDGSFLGGVWVNGDWKSGKFNCDNKPSYWLNGIWRGGDFENGRWFSGEFREDVSKSRFGIKSTYAKNSIWESGVWISGEFHSYLNQQNGINIPSDIHKYSIWKTGSWNSGDFYGGLIFNIHFKNGNFYSGISEEIQIIGININENQIILNGIFRFNIGDYIWITNIDLSGVSYLDYEDMGSNQNPKKYQISNITIDDFSNVTILTLSYNFSTLSIPTGDKFGKDLGIRVVSKFTNTNWYNGLWYNGIFEGGNFYSGMWYYGKFNGIWGK